MERREQSWLSRHPFLHRLFNAALIVFCLWMAWNGVLLALHAL
jgi:hypothetical protein